MSAKLPVAIREQILLYGEYSMGVDRVALRLKDGSVVEDVFVAWGDEVVRVGGANGCPFDPGQVVEALDRPRRVCGG